jgi:hypothetical protein
MIKPEIKHAQFVLPKPPKTLGASHPFFNAANHDKLLKYLQDRLLSDLPLRDTRVLRYAQIDRDVAAFMQLSDEDRKRAREHEKNGTPQATQTSLPLTWVHLDDMMTYFIQTFAPIHGMFYHTAGPESSEVASQLIQLMNSHAVYGAYYRQLTRAFFNILKYNVGGVVNNWAKEYGPKIVMDSEGRPSTDTQTVFAGNLIKAIDAYNFFYDPSCEPSMLYRDGEWFANAEMRSHYWLKKRCLEETFYNCEKILDGEGHTLQAKYYKDPPAEARLDQGLVSRGSSVNWYSFMADSDGYLVNNSFELVTIFVRINPNDFGLVAGDAAARISRNHYENWRFVLANDDTIIQATQLNNVHDHLPAYLGVINDDFMREATKSPAEILNPLQEFSSFLLNAHVLANRKNIYGTTFYDPSAVDYDAVPEGEVGARVPLKPQGWGRDIRTMVYHDSHTLDTKQTLGDLEGMLGIIDKFFPTQAMPSQIAGIDRAVDSQVTAVQQGTTRRQQKSARIIDDAMMRPMRLGMYYNVIQYQEDGAEIADYFNSASQTIDLEKLRSTNISSLIGQGLKSVDRQQIASTMQQVVFAMIQAPQVSQGVDLLAMLDYWLSMLDIEANFKQFTLPPPSAEGAPAGAPAEEPAAGTGITPATNPQNITAPIYG